MLKLERASKANPGLEGIDTVRFLCALWVAISHTGADIFLAQTFALDKSTLLGIAAHGLQSNLFPGPPAVIVFFVVSGFCIHFPNRDPAARLNAAEFYVRRFVRIAPPVAAALLLCSVLTGTVAAARGPLWSLVCEGIYYCIYPVLRIFSRRFSWKGLFLASFLVAILLRLLLGRSWGNYVDYHYSLTWLLGLPCWLLGCLLAEQFESIKINVTRRKVVLARLGVLIAAFICSALRFHSAIDYKITLNFFSLMGALWLLVEIHSAETFGTITWLERAGAWSYSLYLTHMISSQVLHDIYQEPRIFTLPAQILRLMGMVAFAWVFYRAVELPFHRLAKYLGGRVRAKANVMAAATAAPIR